MIDRRRRIARPLPILVFGIVFILYPFVQFVHFAYQLEVSPLQIGFILKTVNPFALFLAFFPLVVGIGILMVKKWGWWAFLGYSILTIFYNVLVLVSEQDEVTNNLIILIQSAIGFSAMFYFLKPDISAPYMNVDSRGWRFQKRKPIELNIKVNQLLLKTKDFSATGFYVEWRNPNLQLNQDVKVEFNLDSKAFSLNAGVVRIDEMGVGIAFRGIERTTLKQLKKWVEEQEVV